MRSGLIATILLVVAMATAGCAESDKSNRAPPTQLQIGVKKRIPEAECKMKSQRGDQLSMHYVGTLYSNGKQFDSSVDRGQPFDFTLGQGQVIKGWDQGLMGMCIGEKRRLVIPPHMAYGERGAGGSIPPQSTLVFETELLDINRPQGRNEL
ncbi:hypothetical protein BC832DRAFT_375859 [Gaertneriomyces semiglobifer]|nr:hypothetical protein BC832DRAFT_375859 [Gaertneriomyces semiglobifer]